MNVTEQQNAPHKRNDICTLHAVLRHIRLNYTDVLGEVHRRACVQAALRANDASVGCRIADELAQKLTVIRQRFARGCGW